MFLVSICEGQATGIMTYDAIIKGIDKQLQCKSELDDKGSLFSFRDITDHRTIKGSSSSYEVLVNWEVVHDTWEPVSVMRFNDPIYLDKYARENDLLDKLGWKQIRRYVNNTNKMNRLLKADKDKQHRNTVKINFGLKIPSDHKEAMVLIPKKETPTGRILSSFK